MPFYPALPEYRPPAVGPFTALISGAGAGQELLGQQAKTAAMREVAAQPGRERAAMKQAVETGDTSALKINAPQLYFKMNEADQKATDYAMEGMQREILTLTDPSQYPAWRQNFIQRHGKDQKFAQALDVMLPKPEQMQSPEQMKAFGTRMGMIGNEVYANRIQQQTDIDLKAKKDFAKAVTIPQQESEQQFRMKLQGAAYDHQKNLQENQQDFQRVEYQKNRDLEEKVKKGTDQRQREQFIMGDFSRENIQLDKNLSKELNDLYKLPKSPKRDQMELTIRQQAQESRDDIVRRYKPIADKYDVPFPFEARPKKEAAPASGFKQPGMYRGPDGKPVAIRTQEEYDRIFKGYAGAPRG